MLRSPHTPQLQANLEKQIKELNLKIVDLETRSYQNSPRPVVGSRRMESRIEELTNQLHQTSRDKTETVRLQRTADRTARDARSQLVESERQRSRLEEEVKAYEDRINSMRQALDELVCTYLLTAIETRLITVHHSKHRKAISNLLGGGQNERPGTTSRKR